MSHQSPLWLVGLGCGSAGVGIWDFLVGGTRNTSWALPQILWRYGLPSGSTLPRSLLVAPAHPSRSRVCVCVCVCTELFFFAGSSGDEIEENVLEDSDADPAYSPSVFSSDSPPESLSSEEVPPSTASSSVVRYPGFEGAASQSSVAAANNATRRKWDRRNICPYCDVPQAKFARHLQLRHKSEVSVQEVLSKSKGSRERKAAFKALKHAGNYAHNVAVRSGRKEGVVIPCNRVSGRKVRTVDDFLPCDLCKGFYYRKTLWRHKRACASAHGVESSGRNIQGSALSQLPTPTGVSHRLSKVIASMRPDAVTLLCKTDPTIMAFGEKLLARLGGEVHQMRHVSQKMRELGRLLQVLKETEDASLRDFLSPGQFEVVTRAVQQVCSYDEQDVRRPSLALKLGHSIKKCAEICLAKAIERGANTETLEQFLRLRDMEWTDQVSRPALQTLKDGNWNKSSLIPMAEDIKKLQDCLNEELESAKRQLQQRPSLATYKAMGEALLARIILFNRRRQGEAGRMRIDDWENSLKSNVPSGVADCLSPL